VSPKSDRWYFVEKGLSAAPKFLDNSCPDHSDMIVGEVRLRC
jgi:hypothetical protein